MLQKLKPEVAPIPLKQMSTPGFMLPNKRSFTPVLKEYGSSSKRYSSARNSIDNDMCC